MKSKKEIERTANSFYNKYFKKEHLSVSSLSSVIREMGYTIVMFDQMGMNEDVDIIVRGLHLEKVISELKAFTYVSSAYRLVFIHEGLCEDEKLVVLTHEVGHIVCEHFGHINIIGINQREEHEANEFAHFLLYPSSATLIHRWLRRNAVICSLAIVILILCCMTVIKVAYDNKYSDYYVTEKGTKYHISSCYVIADKKNVRKLSKEEFDSGKFEPCNICIPDE